MKTFAAIMLIIFTMAAGCSKAPKNEVIVYTSLDLNFSEPILKEFERTTGITVRIQTDTEATKTTGLVNKIILMKDAPEADVFWNNEIIRTIVLKNKGILEPYVPSSAKEIPAMYRDPDGYWTGFAARARVILVNTNLVKPEDAPRSILDLTKPQWKDRVAVANPLFGTTSTHAAVLFATLGPDKASAFFNDLKANGAKIVAGNAMARNMVMEGEIPVCLTDTDDANGAYLKKKPVLMIYPDQDEKGIGTLVIPNSIALIKGGPNPENGKKLIEYLLTVQVERELAKCSSAQIPLRKGIEPYGAEFSLEKIRATTVDFAKAAERLDESARFIQETFLR